MDETFADFLTGLVALRKRIVDDMRLKLKDGTVPSRHVGLPGRDRLRRGSEDRMLAATIPWLSFVVPRPPAATWTATTRRRAARRSSRLSRTSSAATTYARPTGRSCGARGRQAERRSVAPCRTDNTGELPIHAVRDVSGWRQ